MWFFSGLFSGQYLFALGAFLNSYLVMEISRFVFGIGGESLGVAQNTYAASWFRGSALNTVFGLQLSISRGRLLTCSYLKAVNLFIIEG